MTALLHDETFGAWIWTAVAVAFLWNVYPSLLPPRLLVRFASSDTPLVVKGWLMLALLALTVWVGVARGFRSGLTCLILWLGSAYVGYRVMLVLKPWALRRLTSADLEDIRSGQEKG